MTTENSRGSERLVIKLNYQKFEASNVNKKGPNGPFLLHSNESNTDITQHFLLS